MTSFIAWRLLMHEKGRNALAVGGIFIAVLMIFLQLGFYASVPKGAMQIYDNLRFDLMLTSSSYVTQWQPYDFPRRRLYQALSLPDIALAAPVYQSEAQWLSPDSGVRRDVFMMGFKLTEPTFMAVDIERQLDVLQRPDTILVDTLTLPIYGSQTPGRLVETGERTVAIGGQYRLGTGFVGLGVAVASDLNFIRIFPHRSLATINLGLLKLKAGSDPDQVAARLRALLPADTRVFTRAEIEAHEVRYWKTKTSTGLVFGFGVIISIIVGAVILYQTLATQVTRQLPQYATLKAIGYTDGYLRGIVVALAMIMASIAFVPAAAAAMLIYDEVRTTARLPVEMTGERVIVVLVVALAMSVASALVAVRSVHRANPADLF
jgi:putative ABC transport system permease protein